MDFFERYNDYTCVKKNDPDINELYHYTSNAEAVKNIATGCFWATDIRDFNRKEDKNEGHLILWQLLDWIRTDNDIDSRMSQIVEKLIGNNDAMDKFLDDHETYLVSTCKTPDSSYMWNEYAKKNGYEIVLDKMKLINSLYIILEGGKKRKDVFMHAEILYDENEQIGILKKEYQELIELKSPDFTDNINISYVLEHLMYVGNFYKKEDPEFEKEDEYRILINIHTHGNPGTNKSLPKREYNTVNDKHYAEIKFSPKAIKKIVCASDRAKELIEDQITDIDIEIKK